MPLGAIEHGWFVYITHFVKDTAMVTAFDARNEVPHHFKLTIEEVD